MENCRRIAPNIAKLVQEEQSMCPDQVGGDELGSLILKRANNLAPVRPVERRRLRRAGEWRRGRPHLQGAGPAAGSALDVGERS